MNSEITSPATAAAIEVLRADPLCLISLGTLLDELGDKAPMTAHGLLELIGDLIDHPRIDPFVPAKSDEFNRALDFAWNGEE